MISIEYVEAVTELKDILEHTEKKYVEKLPKKLLDFFNEVKSNTYIPNIDYSKPLEEQIKPKTKALIGMIYRNYWCNEEEKKQYDEILNENEEKYQKELREKYNPENIFKNPENSQESRISVKEETGLIEYKEPWYKKIFNKILSILRRD